MTTNVLLSQGKWFMRMFHMRRSFLKIFQCVVDNIWTLNVIFAELNIEPPVNYLALQFKYISNHKYDDKCTAFIGKREWVTKMFYIRKSFLNTLTLILDPWPFNVNLWLCRIDLKFAAKYNSGMRFPLVKYFTRRFVYVNSQNITCWILWLKMWFSSCSWWSIWTQNNLNLPDIFNAETASKLSRMTIQIYIKP